jgi:hypothetical protein
MKPKSHVSSAIVQIEARVNSDGLSGENRKPFNGMTIRDSALN